MTFTLRVKVYGAWLTEGRTAVEIPASKIPQLIADLQAAQKTGRRVDV